MKYFIDCGSWHGKICKQFIDNRLDGKEFNIIAFECNPLLKDYEYDFNCKRIEKAAWVRNEQIKFYLSQVRPEYVQGASIYKEKTTGLLDKENPIEVDAIDFSEWIKNTFTKQDYIVLKMNIEGAEYPILNKMIEDGTLKYIDEIYIHWHWMKIGLPVEDHLKLERYLKTCGIKYSQNYKDMFNEYRNIIHSAR